MERLASKCTELKIDALQDLENILSAGVCVHFSARKFVHAWAVKWLRITHKDPIAYTIALLQLYANFCVEFIFCYVSSWNQHDCIT